MIVIQNSPVPKDLRATRCANCGYSLAGLEIGSACPECGREQDATEIVLPGWARGNFETVENARPARLFQLMILRAGPMLLLIVGHHRDKVFRWIGAITVALFAATIFRRFVVGQSGAQVRIYSRGFLLVRQIRRPSPVEVLFSVHGWMLWLLAFAAIVFWFLTRRVHDPNDLMFLIIGAPYAAVLAFNAFRNAGVSRWIDRAAPENALADYYATHFPLTPWTEAGGFSIEPEKNGFWRLQIWDTGSIANKKKRGRTTYTADIEFEFDAEKVEPLRTLMRSWIMDARSGTVYAKMKFGSSRGAKNFLSDQLSND